MILISQAGLFDTEGATSATYLEQLRMPHLSLATYSIPAGAEDPQQPHTEDEVYVVTGGRGRFTAAGESVEVATGSVIFVPAGEEHRFHDVVEDLSVIVVFAPAEYSRGS